MLILPASHVFGPWSIHDHVSGICICKLSISCMVYVNLQVRHWLQSLIRFWWLTRNVANDIDHECYYTMGGKLILEVTCMQYRDHRLPCWCMHSDWTWTVFTNTHLPQQVKSCLVCQTLEQKQLVGTDYIYVGKTIKYWTYGVLDYYYHHCYTYVDLQGWTSKDRCDWMRLIWMHAQWWWCHNLQSLQMLFSIASLYWGSHSSSLWVCMYSIKNSKIWFWVHSRWSSHSWFAQSRAFTYDIRKKTCRVLLYMQGTSHQLMHIICISWWDLMYVGSTPLGLINGVMCAGKMSCSRLFDQGAYHCCISAPLMGRQVGTQLELHEIRIKSESFKRPFGLSPTSAYRCILFIRSNNSVALKWCFIRAWVALMLGHEWQHIYIYRAWVTFSDSDTWERLDMYAGFGKCAQRWSGMSWSDLIYKEN
jgi:hypothetical protein